MDFVGQRYYRINRIFLEITGLWPYNISIYKQMYRALTFTILVTSSITQFARLQTSIHDLDRLLYNLTYAIPSLIYILKFLSYIIHADEIREILGRIQYDWNILKDGKEREIIRYNTVIGVRFTIVFIVFIFPALMTYIFMLHLPSILDFIHPLNESRPKELPLLSEYFIIDEQKYYYPILIHQSAVIVLGIIVVISTETMNMVYAHHACGLFDVASYRLKQAFEISSVPDDEKYNTIHRKIVRCIKLHKRTVEFLDFMRSTFNLSYAILLMLGVATITINLFRLFQAITAMNDFKELLACTTFVMGQYGYLFFGNYFGQKVTDRSIRLFDMAYEALWYTAPIQIQKVLIFIMQRTAKGYVLTISNIIMASLETFASLASMTLSYLTMIYSVR